GAEQRRELAGAGAAEQVHLEEALLRVDEAGREGDVAAVAAADRRHAARVAVHGHEAAQAGGTKLAVEDRQAVAEEEVAAERRGRSRGSACGCWSAPASASRRGRCCRSR